MASDRNSAPIPEGLSFKIVAVVRLHYVVEDRIFSDPVYFYSRALWAFSISSTAATMLGISGHH